MMVLCVGSHKSSSLQRGKTLRIIPLQKSPSLLHPRIDCNPNKTMKKLISKIFSIKISSRKRRIDEQKKAASIEKQQQQQQQNQLPLIPSSIFVIQILPFLDRLSQNRLCATCKEIYQEGRRQQEMSSRSNNNIFCWPENIKFHVRRPIVSVSFSPFGRSLAVVMGNSRKISIWNRRRGPCQKLSDHIGIVSDVSFSDTGDRTTNATAEVEILASCSRTDGTIRLWRSNNNEEDNNTSFSCFRILDLQVFALRFVRFSYGASEIASWGQDGVIRINDVQDDHLHGSTNWRDILGLSCLDTVAFSRTKSGVIAHTFNNQKVRIWNWTTGRSTELFDQDDDLARDYSAFVTSIAFVSTSDTTSSKEYLLVGCRVAKIKVWDLSDYTCIRTVHLGSGWSGVTHLVISRHDDKCHFACTGEGAQIRIFRFSDGECISTYKDHKDRVQTMAIAPDGTIASGGCDRVLLLKSINASS